MPDIFGGLSHLVTADNVVMFCWLAGLVIFLIIEIITLGLTTIWFAGGALVAFFAALLGCSGWVQIILFFAVSLGTLAFLRPRMQSKLNMSRTKTNVNDMVGKEGRVLDEIDNFHGTGRIVVSGMEWTARAADEKEIIPQGARVEIQSVQGVKAIVLPVGGSASHDNPEPAE